MKMILILLHVFVLLWMPDMVLDPSAAVVQGYVKLSDLRWRDACILPDPSTMTYYLVGPAGRSVKAYTSKDLIHWYGPQIIYTAPDDVWGEIPVTGIWAPELHLYKGKYYLFLTFDTRNMFAEQWRNWLPRVRRGSQILVSDTPAGPFSAFENHSTLPADMMTLDGTLWVEDGIPYMVFCHEWVQISDGAVAYVRLKDDLSGTSGEPVHLFRGSQAPWDQISNTYGCYVTDGPYLYTSKTGKLFMIWTSGGQAGMTMGIAVAKSGKLAGPWKQLEEPVFKSDGGHGMIFKSFEGKLLLILHSPYNGDTRLHLFEVEDTGETLRIINMFTG